MKTGIDNGVSAGSSAVLFAAAGAYLVVTLVDLVDGAAETFVTGRTAQRVMLSLRIRIWAQLQRLSLDYYERELGRPDDDPDDHRRRPVRVVDRERAAVGAGVVRDVPRRRHRAGPGQPRAGPVHAGHRHPARGGHRGVPPPRRAACTTTPATASPSPTPTSRRACPACASRRRSGRKPRPSAGSGGLGADYLASRVAAQRLVATYFPFVQFLSAGADAIVLGVGAVLIGNGSLTSGALIAFILYVDLFFSPIQALSQVFDSWQQTRVSVGRISELMRMDTLTPAADRSGRPGPGARSGHLRGRALQLPSAPPRSARRAARARAGRPAPAGRPERDRAGRRRRCAGSIWTWPRGRRWPSSARPERASPRWSS